MKVLVVWIGGHVGVVVVGNNVFNAVKVMAETGGLFGLRINESGESTVLPIVVGYLDEVDNGTMCAFNVGAVQVTYHRLEGVGSGVKDVGDLV